VPARRARATNLFVTGASNPALGSFGNLLPVGSGFPHNNMQPYLVLNFCIALQGVFPPRT